MASSTISLDPFTWEYDVFLSFRGEDTRKTFTDHLYSALRQAGIHTFRDEEELRKGEYLAPELLRAIRSSRIAVIVFSKDYASSRWCLDELVEIVELNEKGKLIVLPVFYNVDPSEVRKQSGSYGMALAKHKELFPGSDKVHKWRDALTKVADISGCNLQGVANGYESKFINSIIKEVQWIISRVPMFVAKHEVGLDYRVEHVVHLLHGELKDGVRMVGIYGMGGIGKTTLAKAVYNKLFLYFESSCFLEIDSAISGQENNGINLQEVDNQIKKLQKQLFKKLFNVEIDIGSIDEGIMLMKRRLQAKKCLIVIDNLEHRNQFNKLCGGRDWFGEGSRLILTTKEAHVLKELEVNECYEAKVLGHGESLELFSLHAFKQPTLLKEDFDEVLDGIVAYCGGLPLALEVLGCYLYDKSREEWISEFEKLKEIPNNDVQAKLKISYDGLPDDRTKSTFLDIVCFSGYCDKETINCMGNFLNIEIRNLVDRCLIKSYCNCSIGMHDLIREMGREIIRLESPNNPGERSRLWCPKDIHDVLKGQKGTKKIEMIVFDESPMKNIKYDTKAFKNMENLRFLRINGENVHLDGKFKHLSKELRCLKWSYCPLEYIKIPSNSYFGKLVILEMVESNIKEFQAPLKCFPFLEFLDLNNSKYLTKTPDFSGAQKLHTLSFWGCNNLVDVHSSIEELVRLKYLDFSECSKLRKLPNNLCQLLKLESIELEFCEKLEVLPKLSHSVSSWILSGCVNLNMIQEFPPNFTHIYLENCKNLEILPQFPPNLKSICLWCCENLEMLPQLPPNLESISLRGCEKLKILPQLPPNLESFDLSGCRKLKLIPELPPSLEHMYLSKCKKLKMLPQLPPNLEYIYLSSRKMLKRLPQLPLNLRSIDFLSCENLEMLPQLPPNLESINLSGCKKLKMLPQLSPNLKSIDLSGCRKLKMIPELSQKLEILKARNCVSLEEVPNISNRTGLETLDFSGCRELKEIRISEIFEGRLYLGGTPHIIFPDSRIKELLLGSKLEQEFTCTLTCNEIPSWIECKEEGSLLYFQWPLYDSGNYTMGFLGLFCWVVFKAQALAALDCDKAFAIYINGVRLWKSTLWASTIQFDVEEISYLHWYPYYSGAAFKAGEVMTKVTVGLTTGTSVDRRVVKKIGVVALYRDTNGNVQFVPITKVGLNTKKRKRNCHG